ncbi:MAG TPA: nuclear transport factor 2 family protein [Acidobacteriota bacterium]|nr:nuclear transport factor 2 family protein [Acidobacteriota bacterium]
MRKMTFLALCATVLFLAFFIACKPEAPKGSSYAEDRALIEDLQARYMFALDFGDVDKYLATFTPDGVLDIGDGEIRGHDAIRKIIGAMPKAAPPKDAPKLYPATGRHNITNIVIKVEGDKASGRAYWFHYSNNNPQRAATLDGYGHYEDEMVKVNGQWLFTKRRIYNEGVEKWIAKPGNPAW